MLASVASLRRHMATERKLKDPSEAALSAVEQALNLDPLDEQSAAAAGPRDLEITREFGARLPDVSEVDHLPESVRPADLDASEDEQVAALRPTSRPDIAPATV